MGEELVIPLPFCTMTVNMLAEKFGRTVGGTGRT